MWTSTFRRRRALTGFSAVWFAFAGLLVLSAIVAPRSVGGSQLKSLLFFGALLGIAALGQHLVVSVGGMDLSIGPTMTFAGLVFASLSGSSLSGLLGGVAIAVGAAAVVGVINGIAVVVFRITPLIATLAVGTVVTGAAYSYTNGVPRQVSSQAHDLVLGRTAGGFVSVGLILWIVLLVAAALILRYTAPGRRMVAVGAGPSAMTAMGFRVSRYRMSAYIIGSAISGVAGVLLAAVAGLPGVSMGNPYMIATIAAVVLGGTPLGGGLGSVVATAGGALFITQLNASVAVLQASTAVQMIVQGAVIAVAVALYGARRRKRSSGPVASSDHRPSRPLGPPPDMLAVAASPTVHRSAENV